MNNRGQFSIIAALLVAMILVAALMATYSAIRYDSLQEQPQVLSAIDETNLALKQILGFTVGYYGSVLKVTGNSLYARELATNYLRSGLNYIRDIRPDWGISFEINALDLSTNWFTGSSYSLGTLGITYNITGLGISGITYFTSSRLDVLTSNSNSSNQAYLTILKDETEPLMNLGRNNIKFYRYVYEDSEWELADAADITSFEDGTYIIDLPSGVDADSYVIQVKDSRGISVTASSFDSYTLTLDWDEKYSTVSEENIVIELLQNGTMRWLGQNLQLTTSTNPIPPIPIKAFHVTQTIDGVNLEVPFQIEDWASEYQNPLGLASNASLFSNRNMLVFLVNSKVSQVTIWWDGSDSAIQTPHAYRNIYFSDNPSNGILRNGKLNLQISSDFAITSSVGTTQTTATFMRINGVAPSYGANLAYIIYNGVVRDIIHQEAEWSSGITGCPNVYSQIVITLPANVHYYTYQLKLMFINSEQSRTITEMVPIRLSSSLSQIQTENGTLNGTPVTVNTTSGSNSFHNFSDGTWQHHWSQFISASNTGGGIMFTSLHNQKLYVFDSIAETTTGILRADSSNRRIELQPITSSTSFQHAFDVTWHGAVATFDNTKTPIYAIQNGIATGLWVLVEYPPTVTVTIKS